MLIEQSLAKQYGVLPAAQGELPYADWAKLVSGLMQDTPLGQVVAVRSEQDGETVRAMTAGQRRIRSEWEWFCAGVPVDAARQEKEMARLEAMLAGLFGR